MRYAVAVMGSFVNTTDPAPLPDYSEDGVDFSLIRWILSLTPLKIGSTIFWRSVS